MDNKTLPDRPKIDFDKTKFINFAEDRSPSLKANEEKRLWPLVLVGLIAVSCSGYFIRYKLFESKLNASLVNDLEDSLNVIQLGKYQSAQRNFPSRQSLQESNPVQHGEHAEIHDHQVTKQGNETIAENEYVHGQDVQFVDQSIDNSDRSPAGKNYLNDNFTTNEEGDDPSSSFDADPVQ
jgi:hypothetical protein